MTKTKKTKTVARLPQETLVIASRVKAIVHALNMRCDADFIDELSRKVEDKIVKAIDRAKAHNVGTVRARDL